MTYTTKRQQRRAQRLRDKEARRQARQQAAWEKERHRARQHAPLRSVDWGFRPRPMNPAVLTAAVATAIIAAEAERP